MPRRTALQRKRVPTRAGPPAIARSAVMATPPPVRGVKLKTVSIFTIAFAVCCLIAFLVGRTVAPTEAATSTEEPSMFKGLRTVKYDAKNIAEAKAWYSSVLGIQPYFDQPFYVGFEVGGYELGLGPGAASHQQRSPAGIAYWGVDDAHAAYNRLLELGATPNQPVTDVGDGILIGSVHDPFGNVLGVIQNPHFQAK